MKTRYLLFALVLFGALLLAGYASAKASAPAVPEGARAGDLIDWKACEYPDGEAKQNMPPSWR